ncbi:MAG TPA: hypothetical protein DCG69_07220 [Bacteroidales bacterium]|nr:hypothetical protein [Bacteroidales bacterium]
MVDIFSLFQECKLKGQVAVLCLISFTSGSTPRKIGSKMLVHPNGTIDGSVGGGKIEHLVIQEALLMMNSSSSKSVDYDLSGDAAMQCGGKITVYFEPSQSRANLYIFGAGHIGKILARYASEFSFQVVLLDNRAEMLAENQLPGIKYLNGEYAILLQNINFTASTFVVSTTHKHIHDEEIVEYCLQKPHAYIGMMASKRKAALARKKWMENSILDKTKIEQVFAPIGIDIHCETPEEIAISVLAQLIDIKNKID